MKTLTKATWERMDGGFVDHTRGYAFSHHALQELGFTDFPQTALEQPHVRDLSRLWYERRFGAFVEPV